jgi:F-type H+-transporting ATPase subunit epsilon
MVKSTSYDLQVVIVTPEKAVLDARADFVALPMFDGEIGILPDRAPLIGRLGFGELRLRRGAKPTLYYIDGGFVQVRNNTISILTSRAIRGEDIRLEAAQQSLEESQMALRQAIGTEAQESHLVVQQKTRVQIRIAKHAQQVQTHGGQ